MIKYIRNYNVNDIFYNKLNPSGGHHYQILVDKDENDQYNVMYNKRFGPTSHCSRVDITTRFLPVDRRSSSILNSLW